MNEEETRNSEVSIANATASPTTLARIKTELIQRDASSANTFPRIEPMDPIPAGANPYAYDRFHMGVRAENIEVMYGGARDGELSHVIVVNRKTGARFKLVLAESADHAGRFAAFMQTAITAHEQVKAVGDSNPNGLDTLFGDLPARATQTCPLEEYPGNEW